MCLSNIIDGEEPENVVVKAFKVAGINNRRRNFHAVHRLTNQCVVIAKLTNRLDTTDILRQKNKL